MLVQGPRPGWASVVVLFCFCFRKSFPGAGSVRARVSNTLPCLRGALPPSVNKQRGFLPVGILPLLPPFPEARSSHGGAWRQPLGGPVPPPRPEAQRTPVPSPTPGNLSPPRGGARRVARPWAWALGGLGLFLWAVSPAPPPTTSRSGWPLCSPGVFSCCLGKGGC